jgi:predicted house-cleaning noncanonical NTP pyrophosphatase (MazG superfamily)
MGGDGGVGGMVDRDVILEVVQSENWREVRRYLKELRRDLREGFEKLKDCLSCPPNSLFCSEVGRLVESYERALIATIMLKCLLNEGLRVVEDGKLRRRLGEVLEVVNDLVSFLNEKHELVHELVGKCKLVWGGSG